MTYNKHCVRTIPPDCTAIDLSSLEWTLHGNHDYYVTIKVTNLAGLTTTHTSVVYTYDVQPPYPGVVLDINPTNIGNRQLQVSRCLFIMKSHKISFKTSNKFRCSDLECPVTLGAPVDQTMMLTVELSK